MKNEFLKTISEGSFCAGSNLLKNVAPEKQANFLIEATLESSSISIYTFTWFLILQKKGSSILHYYAAEILAVGLTYLEGAYSAALFHARCAVKLDPADYSYKEYLLLFYSIPERLIDSQEAYKIACDILEKDPNNKTALRILNETKESNIHSYNITALARTITSDSADAKDRLMKEAILAGRYEEAKLLSTTILSHESFCSLIISFGFETQSIALYSFVCFLLSEQENIVTHECAIDMLFGSMWHGANTSAYLHARRIVELDPDDLNNKQRLLFYFGIPDCVMSRTEAKQIAHEILFQDPENVEAQETLALIIKTEKRETTGNEK